VKLLLAAAAVLIGLALAISLSRREAAPPQAAAELPPGWGSVVLGAPSEAIPPAPLPPAPEPAPTPQPAPAPQPAPQRGEELVVEPGQSLSMLCKAHYGTASVALVEALARFNGIPSPDALRSGQTLRLPPLATLQKP